MFHDGRVAVNPSQPSGFDSPAGGLLPVGLENVLAAQAMFPVTSPTEMAGQPTENPIANAAAAPADLPLVWELLAARLRDPLNNYSDLFIAAFADVTVPADIQFFHAANAIAAFEAFAWRADDSPFDRFLRGRGSALTPAAKRGLALFYGKAGCAECHSGALLTDLDYHAVAMPQIGPGRGDGYDGHEDYGREQVSQDPGDRYRFRTPSLRNVALTGPWGHAGAYDSLRAVVEHMLDPVAGLEGYDPSQAVLPSRPDLDALDFVVMSDPVRRQEIVAANELAPTQLRPMQIDDLMAFLHALTDPASIDLRNDVPAAVPSGLPLVE
jgi:cytochrome c peroxidase